MTSRRIPWVARGVLAIAVILVVSTVVVSARVTRTTVAAPVVVGDATVADGHDVLLAIQTKIDAGTIGVPTVATPVNLVGSLLALLWIATGVLILSRTPQNLAGWLFTVVGLAWVAQAFGVAVTIWSTIGDGTVPARGLFAIMGDSSLAPVMLVPLLFLLYPDGRPPPRWRWAMWALFAGVAAVLVGFVLGPGPLNNYVDVGILYVNPIGIDALAAVAGALTAVGIITILLSSLATVFAVRGRYRRAAGEERQQMRWLVTVASLAGSLLALAIVITIVTSDESGLEIFGFSPFGLLLAGLALTIALGVPAAYLVAIFRYRLWDLDIVIKKAAIALVLATLIVAIGLVFAANIGQAALWNSTPKAVSAMLGVIFGVMLIPLYRLARRIADRLVYGRRATPYEVLTTFSGRIGEAYASDDVLVRMARVLAAGTGATGARVLVRVGRHTREIASFGGRTGEESRTLVHFQGEELGALVLTMPANDPMSPAKERLVRDLAAQAGPVLHNVRLLEELRASRKRLVAAQDEERRRLERNIHDGVQQQLVALAVRLKLADTLVDRDPAKAHEALAALRADAGTTLDDLRDLARGIYPPLLADKGLVSALEAQARKAAVPTQVRADGVDRYPRDVESTVYFCALEALNNVAKYAGATTARIELAQDDGLVTFRVRDDGAGFDPAVTSYGTGLQGMADRLDAIGGSLDIKSSPGSGTIVIGTVPVDES